ncbi:MAG: cytochrome c oxidase accessory protein CcoG, partial [Xanthomonadales bacterium]|nr:cytochrome c oxidase accessory protein CcoG [Xanthomonadales bacterium]
MSENATNKSSGRDKGRKDLEPAVVSLYEKAEKIYPHEATGRFQSLRKVVVWVLMGIFYVLPWLAWDGRQLLLFDLPARKFHVFGLTFWPQDFILLTGLLIIAALSLFFFTALAGRLWCGYACPQTVWTEVYFFLERLTEGPARRRRKLDAAPWSREKVLRKGAKQVLFIGFALWTGFTFVGYFTPIRELAVKVVELDLGFWEAFWILFYGLATYGNAGYLREQVCKYMCPYARFQGAMFDRDTLIISYDVGRGEPRGARSRKADRDEIDLGDCIDCKMCVQVCPTGIDIRQGLQYECIACGACIDACDEVMDKMEYPRGLVRYTTQNAVEGRPTHVFRFRTFIYAALLLVLTGLWGYGVANRPVLTVDVIRDRNALYRIEDPRKIENSYTLRVINRTEQAREFRISATGLDDL